MSKTILIDKLKKKYPKLNRKLIETIIEHFFLSITKSLQNETPVEIRNLMRFTVKKLKERHDAINPSTQERIYVPSKKVVRIKLSKALSKLINEKEK